MRKIRQMMDRAFLTHRKYFQTASGEILHKNIEILNKVSILSFFIVAMLLLATPLFFPNWSISVEYVVLMGVLAFFYMVSAVLRNKNTYSRRTGELVLWIFLCLFTGSLIAIDVWATKTGPCSFISLYYAVIPTVFILSLRELFPFLAVSETVFLLSAYQIKSSTLFASDAFNSVVGCLCSFAVAWIVNDLRTRDEYVKTHFQKLSRMDQLTNLLNKQSCEDAVAEAIRCEENGYCGLLVMDIDNFKSFNDRYGHQTGDRILNEIGSVIRHIFRSSDILGRIGGDEFMILMQNVRDLSLFDKKCSQLETEIKRLEIVPGVFVTCSCGMTVFGWQETSYERLFNYADTALYEAKNKGRNKHFIYYCDGVKREAQPVMLVADDSKLDRLFLTEIFKEEYHVLEAADGEEALRILHEEAVSIVLLDLQMPGMSGYEVLQQMKQEKRLQHIPVLVSTAEDSVETEEKTLQLGADDVVVKPVHANVVRMRVRNAMQKAGHHTGG